MHVQNVKRRRAALRRQAQLPFDVFPKLLHLFLTQQLPGSSHPSMPLSVRTFTYRRFTSVTLRWSPCLNTATVVLLLVRLEWRFKEAGAT